MLPKLDDYGQPVSGAKGVREERHKLEVFQEFYIEDKAAVENLIEKTLTRVRIEVHLSNGTELGPTEPIDLEPGKKVEVKLSAEGQSFEWWKAHAEVG